MWIMFFLVVCRNRGWSDSPNACWKERNLYHIQSEFRMTETHETDLQLSFPSWFLIIFWNVDFCATHALGLLAGPEKPCVQEGRRRRPLRPLCLCSTSCPGRHSEDAGPLRNTKPICESAQKFSGYFLEKFSEQWYWRWSRSTQIPAGVQADQRIRLSGKGIARISGYGFGDHYVHIKIKVPK